eukprot:jgi/Orpsp1_1/1179730/evm.model.c7180000070562.1
MESLKVIYEEDVVFTLQEWLKKLKQLKVKDHRDALNVISKIMTIFKLMEKHNFALKDKEKVDYMLGCLPRDLKIIFISGKTNTADKLFEDIKLKCHYYNQNLNKYLKNHNINKSNNCIHCNISKLNRLPHNKKTPKTKRINKIIHTNIMGPLPNSINNYKYIITFTDDFSRKAWVYLSKTKSESTETIKNFINPPYNPQNNGIAERLNRTLQNCTKTILEWSKLDLMFLDFAIKHAIYIYNLIPHIGIKNKIPNEVYFNKKSKLNHLKTFGCILYYKIFNNKSHKFQPNSRTDSISNLNNNIIANIDIDVPLNYNDAINRSDKIKWIKTINTELENMYKNKVMIFIKELPPNINVISTKWVFTVKRNSKNEIIIYKARLVARGFHQIYGIDYDITYSPTIDITCIRFILCIATKLKWNTYQLDIQAADLNATLDKKIYISIPKGDKNYGKGFWLLNKSLYGLKQSGRNWNQTISNFLIDKGFIQSSVESCLFFKKHNNSLSCIIGLFVDDMIITGNHTELFHTIYIIKNKFSISKCQPINYILGIKIEQEKFNYSISQPGYIDSILS